MQFIPITIDPLMLPLTHLEDCDQALAQFGSSVASAGDVMVMVTAM